MQTWLHISNSNTSGPNANVELYINEVFKGNYSIAPSSSVSKFYKRSPKTGVRAYARTPVFGYFFNFRDLLKLAL